MPIESTTYNGVPAGINLAKPAFELADNEARYLRMSCSTILVSRVGAVQFRQQVAFLFSPIPALPSSAR